MYYAAALGRQARTLTLTDRAEEPARRRYGATRTEVLLNSGSERRECHTAVTRGAVGVN